LFVIAVLKKTGERIIWPKPTHGKPGSPEVLSGKLLPWRTAADIIDFSLPCPSIFMSQQEAKAWRMATGQSLKRPLAEATMRRIAQGLKKFVFQASDPFIVTANHQGNNFRGQGLTEPFKTITASRDAHGLVMPYLTEHANATSQRTWSGNEPLRTQCANVKGGHFALAQAFLAKHYGGVVGTEASNPFPTITTRGTQTQLVTAHIDRQFGGSEGHGIDEPSGTITAGGSGKSALVSSNLIKMRGTCRHGQKTDQPTPTITAGGMHIGEVRAFLQKYYGCENGQSQSCAEPMHTVPTKQRFGLVTVDGEDYQITDIGMRMLTPKELFSAQGFPDSYKIDIDYNGKKLTKTAQIRMCGNSVCPPLAKAIIQANFISTNQMQAAE
jgi:DNA (cytosine-5)-methyltransferase 1